MGSPRWSQEHLDYLMAYYPNTTIPLVVIAEHVGRNIPAVCRMAHVRGLYRIGPGYIKHFPDPFADSTPASMWVLGLWFTDGHVTQKEAYLTQKDRGLLEQVRSIVASPPMQERVKIFPYHGKSPSWVLQISSVEMVQYLETRGVVRRKSHTMRFPNWMTDTAMPHFVRGLWDGDGYIGIDKDGRLSMVYACGSLMFLESLVGILAFITKKTVTIRKQKLKACYTIAFHQDSALSLANWMYKDSTDAMRLQRKYDRYLSYQSYAA